LSEPEGLSFLWTIDNFGGGQDTTSEVNPYYRWGEPNENTAGAYGIQLEAFWLHMGPDSLVKVCADTAWDTVTIVNDFLEFPNMVSPNGDGENDTWEVVNLVEIGLFPVNELWIYNQWGVKVFHARDIRRHEDFWDPNATNSPDGTYYYRFAAMSDYGVVKKNGTIEVIRGN
jgi:gliding motility-associated-like protein